jgi:hypothetical protein
MCPSSRSWPPKLNRDTGQNLGRNFTIRGLTVVLVRDRMGQHPGRSRAVPRRAAILLNDLNDWSDTGERGTPSPGAMTVFFCWRSSPSLEFLRPELFSGAVWISWQPPLIRVRYTGNQFGRNRALHNPLAYRPKTNCEPRMGANLAMNPAAVLTNRRYPNAQYLADGTATLARTNQSDQGNFPGSEPIFLREKTHAATKWTRWLPTLRLLPPRPAPRY